MYPSWKTLFPNRMILMAYRQCPFVWNQNVRNQCDDQVFNLLISSDIEDHPWVKNALSYYSCKMSDLNRVEKYKLAYNIFLNFAFIPWLFRILFFWYFLTNASNLNFFSRKKNKSASFFKIHAYRVYSFPFKTQRVQKKTLQKFMAFLDNICMYIDTYIK